MNIYTASSWRNKYYDRVVQALRIDGHEVYGIFTELVDLQLALKAHEHLFADPITTEEATTKIG